MWYYILLAVSVILLAVFLRLQRRRGDRDGNDDRNRYRDDFRND